MQPTIELSNQIGAVLITLNAALVAWIVYSTWQEKRNAPADRLAAALAIRAVDLAYLCSHDEAGKTRMLEKLIQAHGEFADRHVQHGPQVSEWFAEELLALTLAAARLSPDRRRDYVWDCLKLLSVYQYTPNAPHSYDAFEDFFAIQEKESYV